jgi:hypothetical protein
MGASLNIGLRFGSLVGPGAVAVAFVPLADDVGQCIYLFRQRAELLVGLFLAIGESQHGVREFPHYSIRARHRVMHQYLSCQQVMKAVTKLLQGRLYLAEPLVGIGLGVHVTLLYPCACVQPVFMRHQLRQREHVCQNNALPSQHLRRALLSIHQTHRT